MSAGTCHRGGVPRRGIPSDGGTYHEVMATSSGRSLLATIVGWIVVALIVWFLFGWILGTLRFILRIIVILVVIGALASLYFRLRGDD